MPPNGTARPVVIPERRAVPDSAATEVDAAAVAALHRRVGAVPGVREHGLGEEAVVADLGLHRGQ